LIESATKLAKQLRGRSLESIPDGSEESRLRWFTGMLYLVWATEFFDERAKHDPIEGHPIAAQAAEFVMDTLKSAETAFRPQSAGVVIENRDGKQVNYVNNAPLPQTAKQDIQLPCTRLEGWIKRIDSSSLSEMGRAALDFAFPRFLPSAAPSEDQRARARLVKSDEVMFRLGQQRRFSGDDFFDPGRYYTLSVDQYGNDANTLCAELLAYSNLAKSGPVEVADLVRDDERAFVSRMVGKQLERTPHIVVTFIPHNDKPTPFGRHLGRTQAELIPVFIPYRVERVSIDRVVDLRQPLTQTWLAETFGKPREIGFFSWKNKQHELSGFGEMFGALINPNLGGNEFTQMIGSFLRTYDANGFVFPSARTNAAVLIRDNLIGGFGGWNFVDYRNAPVGVQGCLDVSTTWERKVPAGVRLHFSEDPLLRGSMEVTGLWEAWNSHRDEEMSAYEKSHP
jgi:hypothetical protein